MDFRTLEKLGIIFMGQQQMSYQKKNAGSLAMDAQPELFTQSNSGIPAFLSTFIDPRIIDILFAPMRAAEIVGDEVKKGDWVTMTAMFPVAESVGEVSSYGDYSENGHASANVNYINRQSYHYQTTTEWGEREMATAGLGHIDWANQLSKSSILTLNKYQNKTYFYGVQNLENYGLLNDPSLLPAITPNVKASGGVAWSPEATALEVYGDIQSLIQQVIDQGDGVIDLDSPMTLAMSPSSEVALTKTDNFNVNVRTLLKTNFPNLTVKVAPEYATAAGNMVQLIVNEVEGVRTASCAFTEKMRAHPIVIAMSSFKQKKSQGSWGTIIVRPFAISAMIGV